MRFFPLSSPFDELNKMIHRVRVIAARSTVFCGNADLGSLQSSFRDTVGSVGGWELDNQLRLHDPCKSKKQLGIYV